MSTPTGVTALHISYITGRSASNDGSAVEINTTYGALWGTPSDCTAYFDALLRGLEQQEDGQYQLHLAFTRIEFVFEPGHTRHKELRGAILFDQHDQPVLHFGNALLGYEGSGPYHSRDILALLGAPPRLFDDINGDVADARRRNEPYTIIVRKLADDHWDVARIL